MKQAVTIRSTSDRIRYALSFEALLMVVLAVCASFVLERGLLEVGSLTLLLSLKAMAFNFIYNWIFDRIDARAGRIPTERSFAARATHAVGFELSLIVTSLPLVMWWLKITLLQALAFDLAAATFIVIYTMAFTWSYDRLFPVAQQGA